MIPIRDDFLSRGGHLQYFVILKSWREMIVGIGIDRLIFLAISELSRDKMTRCDCLFIQKENLSRAK
jgi:hypothetical protein